MRLFKLLVVSLLTAFTFFVAPGISGLRAQEPQTLQPPSSAPAITPRGPSLFELLAALEEEPALPVVECVSDARFKTDRCVPKYRFSEGVSDRAAKKAVAWIEAANKAGADEILLEINTGGGSVPAGFEISRAIEDSNAPVTCVVDGEAASMGFYVLQSCEKRLMTRRSRLMAHEPSLTGMMGGNPNDWQSITDNIKATAETMAWWCWHRLKVSRKFYDEKTVGSKQWWVLVDEAKKIGAVDDEVESVKLLHQQMLHGKH